MTDIQMEKIIMIANSCSNYSRIDLSIEEMSELIKELCKYRRYGDYKYVENIKGEIADVEIMLAQLKKIFDISESEIDKIKDYKLDRALNTIEGE